MSSPNLKHVLTGKPQSAVDFTTLWILMMLVVIVIQAIYAALSSSPLQYFFDWVPLTVGIAAVLGIVFWIAHRRRQKEETD